VAAFGAGENAWVERLGGLRNTVRQELVTRQLALHGPRGRVLDVGCGQGTQAIRLAQRGCLVTGLDPSPELLQRMAKAAEAAAVCIEGLLGTVEDLDTRLADHQFDVVCAHGLLMYLPDTRHALRSLAARVSPGGLLSVTFRNASALAFRPGIRRQWRAALRAFDADTYVNELGVLARADSLKDVAHAANTAGLHVEAWYGVRVFTDPADATEAPPVDATELEALVQAEFEAGRRDPYRQLASQIHLLARRQSPEATDPERTPMREHEPAAVESVHPR
jgi:S-adenosylmethionine-dependent methyltransferase